MITSEQRADAVAILQRISEWLEGAAPWPLTPPRQFTVDGTRIRHRATARSLSRLWADYSHCCALSDLCGIDNTSAAHHAGWIRPVTTLLGSGPLRPFTPANFSYASAGFERLAPRLNHRQTLRPYPAFRNAWPQRLQPTTDRLIDESMTLVRPVSLAVCFGTPI